MILLIILYACWIAFWGFLWIISPMVAHNPNRIEEFFIMLGLDLVPLLVYSLFCLMIKRNKKYLIMFCVLLLYYPLAFVAEYIFRFGIDSFFSLIRYYYWILFEEGNPSDS